MKKLTTAAPREIVSDFAKEIKKRRERGPKPSTHVVEFRNDVRAGKERDVYFVPLGLLRYRKDNGRIASDVLSYEKHCGRLDEKSEKAQEIIRGFLEQKDKEKTEELKRAIEHDTQREPAIITCDGFLINGNRRKMVLEMLNRAADSPRFPTMKVVILPGEDDEGGPPTLLDIEQIENRYQLQSDGKAEYYAFDKALSMQRKIERGMSLEEQLRDDPQYAGLDAKQFERAVEKMKTEFLGPLECIERYLEQLNRDGLYNTISTGIGDPEGRWLAFLDYYQYVYKKLNDPKELLKLNLREDEVGKVEDAAFKLIRKREFGEIGRKVHMLMRELPSVLKNEPAKRELFKINLVDLDLPKDKRTDADGKEHDERTVDKIWAGEKRQQIIHHLNKALILQASKEERETPLHLLEVALSKLEHNDMRADDVEVFEYKRAMDLTRRIQKLAKDLEHEFYVLEKNKDSLKSKK